MLITSECLALLAALTGADPGNWVYKDTVETTIGTFQGSVSFLGIDSIHLNQPNRIALPRQLIKSLRLQQPNGAPQVEEVTTGAWRTRELTPQQEFPALPEPPKAGAFVLFLDVGAGFRPSQNDSDDVSGGPVINIGTQVLRYVGKSNKAAIGIETAVVHRLNISTPKEGVNRTELLQFLRVGPVFQLGTPRFHASTNLAMEIPLRGEVTESTDSVTTRYKLETKSSSAFATGLFQLGAEVMISKHWGIGLSYFSQLGSVIIDGVDMGSANGFAWRSVWSWGIHKKSSK